MTLNGWQELCLFRLDDRAADRARAGEPVVQFVALAAPDGPLQRGQILAEALQQFEHGLAIGQKNVAPHHRVGRGDPGKIAKPAGRIGDDLRLQILAKLGRGADDRVGDQMRQMRGDRQHLVVMIGRHCRHPHPGQFPQRPDPGERVGIGFGQRRQDAPAVAKQFGEKFAAKLGGFAPGQWQGPVESGYGMHLVLVSERTEGRPPVLAEVRDAVLREWASARRQEANEQFYQNLLKRYVVTIENLEPVAGQTKLAEVSR